jgi:hypothetical protein
MCALLPGDLLQMTLDENRASVENGALSERFGDFSPTELESAGFA